MRRAATSELPATVTPCKEYQMSDRFRDWAVAQMSREVGGQLSAAGLDRMAILKAGKAARAGGPDTIHLGATETELVAASGQGLAQEEQQKATGPDAE